ncbi:hypothetical protein QR680_014250 [Steinernema hermaphroditum]|uniref:Uncharacterized protein n=1 Tax=Steinernema hermaphroditum TaxID=289476 RepID=A0AA39M3R2_9BILA|nr:hypothetical protein QR680_014250 [Steinernema hermaphroditum]
MVDKKTLQDLQNLDGHWGHCKFGNIHHPAVANGLISVSVSRDCPAFVLIPTNAAEYQTSASNCPLLGMATVEPITVPANMRVDVKTIQNGLRKLEDPLIATYTPAISNPIEELVLTLIVSSHCGISSERSVQMRHRRDQPSVRIVCGSASGSYGSTAVD